MIPDLAFLNRLADAAKAETLPRFRTGVAIDNKYKVGFDPVTEADQAAEAAIRALIQAEFPDHGILGEEHGGEGLDQDYVWVIDPIDGTRAFISGLPVWGTLVGLYHHGRAIMGLMDQPFTGERYLTVGEGTYYRGPEGEKRLKTRACATLGEATMFTTSPFLYAPVAAGSYKALEAQVRLARYGCDCYAFALLASGHVDLVCEGGLKPYDIAALIPLIEQAGGIVTDWKGGRPEQGGDILAAGDPALHAQALALLASAAP